MATFLDDLQPTGTNPFASLAANAPGGLLSNLTPPPAMTADSSGAMSLPPPIAPAPPPQAPPAPPIAPPVAAAPQGFLSRLMAPSENGLTFADKLMAAGSLLKGDTAGAHSYLKDRLEAVQKATDTATKQKAARAAANVLAQNTNPDNTINIQGYLRGMALIGAGPDDKVLSAIYAHNLPENVAMSGPNGSVNLIRKNPPEGQAPTSVEVVKPQAKIASAPYGIDPDTQQPTPQYLKGVTALAAAQRAGKPLAPRAPPKGPRRLSFDPSEVH